MPRRVAAFPWSSLSSVSRHELRAVRAARVALARGLRVDILSVALASATGLGTRIELRGARWGWVEPPSDAVVIGLELADESAVLGVLLDRQLAARWIAALLGRPPRLLDPNGVVGHELRAALAALVIEVARRAGVATPLRAVLGALPYAPCVSLGASVYLDEEPFDAALCAWPGSRFVPWRRPTPRASELRVCVPVVAARVLLDRAELALLTVGAALRLTTQLALDDGAALLLPPSAERGIAVTWRGPGQVVVGGALADSAWEPGMSEGVDETTTVGEAALEAPVVVRIEVAEVTLSAREWLGIGAGDVLETQQRVGASVTLRIAGQAVARGELVDVEGALGVRIAEVLT